MSGSSETKALSKMWEGLPPNMRVTSSFLVRVVSVCAYIADYRTFAAWRKSRAEEWRKGMILPCFDLTLQTVDGHILTVQLDPALTCVQSGLVLEGDWLLITEVSKVLQSPGRDPHLMVYSWTPHHAQVNPDVSPSSLPPLLQDYSTARPLGHPGIELLCPWTFFSPCWPPACLPHVPTLHRDPTTRVTNLVMLDTSRCSSDPPHLVVRVLATSRTRYIIQQDNITKPLLVLKNLLVVDRSAHTVITLWDDAVRETIGSICEGDIIRLEGKYRINRRQDDIKQRLEPKLRVLGVSPTQAEIKLNSNDLSKVTLFSPHAVVPGLPSCLWHFLTVSNLASGRVLGDGRIVDLVGRVIRHGRWERQACSRHQVWGEKDSPIYYTGQYWVRLWLQVADHTSTSSVAVKVYLDREKWVAVAGAVPGNTLILTNLMYRLTRNAEFSHLETSTETQVFCGIAAEDGRFAEDKIVAGFREASEVKIKLLDDLVEQQGRFGGHWLPEEVETLDTKEEELIGSREEMQECVDSLVWKEIRRVRVKARLGQVGGKVDTSQVMFALTPEYGSLPRKVSQVKPGQLAAAVVEYCQMESLVRPGISVAIDENQEAEEREMIVLHLCDCHLVVQCGNYTKQELVESEGRQAVICLDLFRLRPREQEGEAGSGVEVVLRAVSLQKESEVTVEEEEEEEVDEGETASKKIRLEKNVPDEEVDGEESESDWSVHTQDLLELMS